MSFMEDFAEGFGTSFTKGVQSGIDAFQAEEKEKLKSGLTAFGKNVTSYNDAKALDSQAASLITANVDVSVLSKEEREGIYGATVRALRGKQSVDSIVDSLRAKAWKQQEAAPTAEVPDVEVQTDDALSLDEIKTKVQSSESSDRQTDKDGGILTSIAGALGIMQVQPATARDPGDASYGFKSIFDIAREKGKWEGSKEEQTDEAAAKLLEDEELNKAMGDNYLEGLHNLHNGDAERILVGYNWGLRRSQEWDGNRDSLPIETRNYLNKILGPKDGADKDTANILTQEQYDEDINPLIKQDIMAAYGVSEAQYRQITQGYQTRYNNSSYILLEPPKASDGSTKTDADIIGEVRANNYHSLAEQARLNNKPELAAMIEATGQKYPGAGSAVPKYKDFTNNPLTTSNAAGRRHAALLVNDEEAVKAIDKFIFEQITIEDVKDLTPQNADSYLRAARMKNDQVMIGQIIAYKMEQDSRLPSKLSKGYIQTQYATKRLNMENNPDDPMARNEFITFRDVTLPVLLEAMNATEGEKPPESVFQAYMAYMASHKTGDPNKISEAKATWHASLRAMQAEEMVKQNAKTREVVVVNKDGTWKTSQAIISGDKYVSVTGEELGGTLVKEVPASVLKEASTLTTSFESRITAFEKQNVNLREALEISGDIREVLTRSPRALTAPARGAKFLAGMAFNVGTAVDILDELMEDIKGTDKQLKLETYEDRLRSSGVLGPTQTLAEALSPPKGSRLDQLTSDVSVFQGSMILLTFKAGGLEGQSGNAMSNKDFDRLNEFLSGKTVKADVLLNRLATYMQTKVTSLNQTATKLNEHPKITQFEGTHGFSPIQGGLGNNAIVTPISPESTGSNLRLQNGWNLLSEVQTTVVPPREPAKPVEETDTGPTVDELLSMIAAGKPFVVTQELADAYPKKFGNLVGKSVTPKNKTTETP